MSGISRRSFLGMLGVVPLAGLASRPRREYVDTLEPVGLGRFYRTPEGQVLSAESIEDRIRRDYVAAVRDRIDQHAMPVPPELWEHWRTERLTAMMQDREPSPPPKS